MFVAFQHKKSCFSVHFYWFLISCFCCLFVAFLPVCTLKREKDEKERKDEKKEKRKRSFDPDQQAVLLFCFFFVFLSIQEILLILRKKQKEMSQYWTKNNKRKQTKHISLSFLIVFDFVCWVFVWKEKERDFLCGKREIEQFLLFWWKEKELSVFIFKEEERNNFLLYWKSLAFICCFEKKELFHLRKFVVFKEVSCFGLIVKKEKER